MNPAASPTQNAKPQSACLSNQQLHELLDDVDTDSQQAALIAHLDQCDACRVRLETSAADREQWSDLRRNLQPDGSEEVLESDRLTAAIRSLCEPTETELSSRPDCQSGQHTSGQSGSNVDQNPTDGSAIRPIERIGPYRIVDQVGRGGMGVVYKAFDPKLQRHVAIKRIADSLLEQPGAIDRFRREARAAAAVHDPHVVAIHAIEDSAPHPYLVMEFVEGQSLAQWIDRDGRLAWQDVARIGAEAAAGLAAAHAAGVIHRDVKPANILIEQATGRVKLSDFGLARMLVDGSLTQTGCVRGTPEYLSPEQAAGDPVDHRSDLFSLGSALYAACTGHPPFQADNTMAVLRRTREDRHRPIGEIRDDVPQPLIQVIDRLLNKNPDDRFATAREVAEVLSRIQQGETVGVQALACERGLRGGSLKAVLQLAALLLVAVGIGVGGIYAGAALLQAEGEVGATLVAAKGKDKSKKNRSTKQPAVADAAPVPVVPPTRVQIVQPDDLLRERIRAEKDQLELPRHPLLVGEFTGHTGPVNSIAITPDAKTLVSASGWPVGDRSARVWDLETGKELRQFDVAAMPKNQGDSGGREAPGEIFTVAVTPDGKHAVTGATAGAVCVWSIATGELVRQFDRHTATVYDSAISANGDVVLSGGRSGIGRLWSLKTGQELMQLTGHRSWIRCVAMSPDGKRALTGSYDKTLRLWDLERAELVRQFQTQANWIWDIAFAPSGTVAACISGRAVQM